MHNDVDEQVDVLRSAKWVYLVRKAHLSSPEDNLFSKNSKMPVFPSISGCVCVGLCCVSNTGMQVTERMVIIVGMRLYVMLFGNTKAFFVMPMRHILRAGERARGRNAGLFKAERRTEAQVTERDFGKKQRMPRELSPSLRDVC